MTDQGRHFRRIILGWAMGGGLALAAGCAPQAGTVPAATATATVAQSSAATATPATKHTNDQSGNIRITAPASGATVSSPVRVTGQARNIFEGQFMVQVKDDNGHVLGQVQAQGGSGGQGSDWQTWTVDVPYALSVTGTPGFVAAFDLSPKDGRVIDLVTIPVMLMGTPPAPTKTPATASGNITITSPTAQATVGSPVHVTGQARQIFEGQFTVQVRDGAGHVLGEAHAYGGSAGQGTGWQDWAVDVPYTLTAVSASGAIVAFNTSAMDGHVTNLVTVPVTLRHATATQNITITSPKPGTAITSPLHVTGQARQIFEGQFTVQVRDGAGNVLGEAHATGGSPGVSDGWQDWSVDMSYTLTGGATSGFVVAFNRSAMDGSMINLVTVPVTFSK